METHILVSFDRNAVAGAVIGVRTLGALPFDGQVLKVQVAARLAFGDVCGIDAGGLLRCIDTLVGIEVQEGDVPDDDVTAILDMYAPKPRPSSVHLPAPSMVSICAVSWFQPFISTLHMLSSSWYLLPL